MNSSKMRKSVRKSRRKRKLLKLLKGKGMKAKEKK